MGIRPIRRWRNWTLLVFLLSLFPIPAHAQSQISIPAIFLRFLNPPGAGNGFLRPSCLTVDRAHGEILVGDSGKHRVVIFDTQGRYRFEFAGDEHFASLSDLAVEPRGTILVLGSTREGRKLLRFDFDGLYLGELPLAPDELRGVLNFDLDAKGVIYLLRQRSRGCELAVYQPDGSLTRSFPLGGEDEGEEDAAELVAGQVSVRGEKIYVPLSSEGRVKIFDLKGRILRVLGSPGSAPGHFAFPVAVDVADDGTILVLDKHRYNVLCFDRWGKFLGEFGGRGQSPGWFYFPDLLGVDSNDQVYIGQVFMNRVQTCAIPEVIRPQSPQSASQGEKSPRSSFAVPRRDDVPPEASARDRSAETAAEHAAQKFGAKSVVPNHDESAFD